ncbi:M48 family metallopeptidase [Colwellia psychrerythraea]|uniref:Peptidase M48 Ste24p n=1 Tax=Colwellia psychrerythraea TaxID=28229 RepID=A0A099KXB8_COLPS|nr:M48 family metallopeptidase [Colwellia psychrerythraea]KGJ95231.1 peptidase M48 Ste24p [Colwellia psychrerythraea]
MLIEGIYLDGKTSKRNAARLEVNSNHKITAIHLTEQQKILSFEHQSYVVESRLGNTPREITFDDEQLFVCDNHEEIDKLITWQTSNSSNQYSWLYHLENNSKLIFISTITTVILLYGIVVYGIPSTAKLMAHNVPYFTSAQLFSSLDILDETVFEPSTLPAKRQQEIRTLVAPYLSNHKSLQPKLEFRSGMEANALALPNGVIVFTDDFVNLTQTDDELVAVLFHELGHLTQKHMTQRIIQDAMLTIMVIFITGDVETFDLVTGLPTLLLDLTYSREFETEADTYALTLLNKHDIPLQSFVDAMTNLENYYLKENEGKVLGTVNDFFSTHPKTSERIILVETFKE